MTSCRHRSRPHPHTLRLRLAWRTLALVLLPALAAAPLLLLGIRVPCGWQEGPALFTHAEPPLPAQPREIPRPADCPAMHPPVPEIPCAAAEPLPVFPCTDATLPAWEPEPALPLAWANEDFAPEEQAPAPTRPAARPTQRTAATTKSAAKPAKPAAPPAGPAPAVAAATPPAYRSAPKPPYPAAMRQRRIQGSVGVRISISPAGKPTAVAITAPSGHAEFDSATRSWILNRWSFHPATRAGTAVAGVVNTTVHFKL